MPLFLTRKEVYNWLKEGKKTIEIRKGKPSQGNTATFQTGKNHLRFTITKKETGKLTDLLTPNNYTQIIPTAQNRQQALNYIHQIYGTTQETYTAYHLTPQK